MLYSVDAHLIGCFLAVWFCVCCEVICFVMLCLDFVTFMCLWALEVCVHVFGDVDGGDRCSCDAVTVVCCATCGVCDFVVVDVVHSFVV